MNSLKLKSLLLAVFFLTALAPRMNADSISPQQALKRATSSLNLRTASASSYQLVAADKIDNLQTVYLFSNPQKGYIVTPADDELPAVLGYADNGTFDENNISPELKWWLSEYDAQIKYFQANPQKFQTIVNVAQARAERKNIDALVSTKWNQDWPYNMDCPSFNGRRTMTGCVATAMAQVVNYHKYPAKGVGSRTYSFDDHTLSYDFGNATFDYENMIDSYNGGYNDKQATAVANLMYACGVAVAMHYGVYESGAANNEIAYGLKEYFNFDGTTKYLMRQFFSDSQWDQLIYEELAAARPVLYGGYSSNGGHQFVCDGYRDGYFHINWGWGGMSDGYFLLSALNPSDQGIGSFEGGYNQRQDIVCGIKPYNGTPDDWYPIYGLAGIKVLQVERNSVKIGTTSTGVFNYSPKPVKVDAYLKVIPKGGSESQAVYSSQGIVMNFAGSDYTQVSGFSGFWVYSPAGLPEGKYEAYPVIKTPEGKFQEILFPYGEANHIDLSVDAAGKYTYSTVAPGIVPEIKVTSLTPTGDIKPDVETTFNLTIENIGNIVYSGAFYIRGYKEGTTEQVYNQGVNIDLPAGETLNGSVKLTFPLPDGNYDLVCFDGNDKRISDTFTIKVGTGNSVELMLEDGAKAQIYSIDGRIISQGADKEFINSLPRGIYILKIGEQTLKLRK